MKRIVVFLLPLALLGGLAWGNADIIRHDPSSGVILPAGPTPVRVERESLDIEFQPFERPDRPPAVRAIKVRAQYWLHNPTAKPLELQIGFPVPGNMGVVEPPVWLDGRLGEWRLLSYEELIKPLQPALARAMRRWADRHPVAMRLAKELGTLGRLGLPGAELKQRNQALMQALNAELIKAGAASPSGRASYLLRESQYAARNPQDWTTLRAAILATGQEHLLPEGRWHVERTLLDPATGRPTQPPWADEDTRPISMLVFPLRLQPNGRHHLKVIYRQGSGEGPEGPIYHFAYILRTTRAWADFGPIEITATAPPALVFRSLPALRYVGMSHGLKVYQGTIVQPKRNLQVALARPQEPAATGRHRVVRKHHGPLIPHPSRGGPPSQ